MLILQTSRTEAQTPIYAGIGGPIGPAEGVFRSTDGGMTWSAVNNGLNNRWVRSLAIDPTDPSTLYAGTNGGGVFKTTSGGADWVAINSGLTSTNIDELVIDLTNPNT
jgi:photosystem II stability/assembly factor-like uncharacterized protein